MRNRVLESQSTSHLFCHWIEHSRQAENRNLQKQKTKITIYMCDNCSIGKAKLYKFLCMTKVMSLFHSCHKWSWRLTLGQNQMLQKQRLKTTSEVHCTMESLLLVLLFLSDLRQKSKNVSLPSMKGRAGPEYMHMALCTSTVYVLLDLREADFEAEWAWWETWHMITLCFTQMEDFWTLSGTSSQSSSGASFPEANSKNA